MRKYLFSILAFLFFVGIANAAGIPTGVDPQNGTEIWTQSVYNNSGSAITSGSVVVWDMDADTADATYAYRTGWITTTTTVDDIQTAGVILTDSCAIASTCTIGIYGPMYVRTRDSSDAVTANQAVGTSGSAGQCGGADAANDKALLGWSILAAPVAVANGGYGGTDGQDGIMTPVFVHITPMVN